MDVFEFAKKMELDGKAYYDSLKAETANPGLKALFGMLSDAEQSHYEYLTQAERGAGPEVRESTLLNDVKNIFEGLDKSPDESGPLSGQISACLKARDIEERGRVFYEEKVDQETDPGRKALFIRLAEEETDHFLLLGEMAEFMRRPEAWNGIDAWRRLRGRK